MCHANSASCSAPTVKQRGFLLTEMLVAIAVFGVLVLVVMQWQQQQHRQQQLQDSLDYAQRLVSVLQDHYMHYDAYPSSMAALVATGLWQQTSASPLASNWQWRTVAGQLELSWTANSAAQAQWLGSQWLGSVVTGREVVYRQLIPIQLGPADPAQWLHRQAVAGQPELNQMQTTLDFGGHDLTNVGQLDAIEIQAMQLTVDELETEALAVERLLLGGSDWSYANGVVTMAGAELAILGELQVQQALRAAELRATAINADHMTTTALTTTQLQAAQLQASELSAERLILNELEADRITAETISATELAAVAVDAQRVTAGQLQVGAMNATVVEAGEVFAGDVSLKVADQRLSALAALWQECIDRGGCQ